MALSSRTNRTMAAVALAAAVPTVTFGARAVQAQPESHDQANHVRLAPAASAGRSQAPGQAGVPNADPTAKPTDSPTATPTGTPTGSPTATPTGSPSDSPTATPTGSPSDSPTGGNGSMSAEESKVLELTNAERAKEGLNPLKANECLQGFGDKWAASMAASKNMSHQSLDPIMSGCKLSSAAENVAAGQTSPEEVVKAWMNSPGHRANIMNPSTTMIGIGMVDNYWVQDFGS